MDRTDYRRKRWMSIRQRMAIMTSNEYGRYLAIRYPEVMAFVESHGMYMTQEELEKLVGTMFQKLYDSISILIDYGVGFEMRRRKKISIFSHIFIIHTVDRVWLYGRKSTNKIFKHRKITVHGK